MQEQHHGNWYAARLRVRYQESDQMGVVYHANYLNWFEIGRTEMIRQMGYTYRKMEEQGLLLPVTGLDVKYHKPAKYDDEIMILTRIVAFSGLRLNYEYDVRRMTEDLAAQFGIGEQVWASDESLPGERLVTGSTQHVWVNGDWKPVRLDKAAPELYSALEKVWFSGKE
ncbi:thioesterase family protein [Paenibacillus sp. ACRRY]|uniref:acyl-CoA thioesterase n=1 Tax=Paenibacillus sp. ACRRY TaxID=2918208 RepID=UPI001EF5A7DA|nr:thioesterase family protein [Paenibacillus sp. ACRRY]MCG7384909.1 acyl-CoA thioesterase [Paenibacillus sp. ACRRY]